MPTSKKVITLKDQLGKRVPFDKIRDGIDVPLADILPTEYVERLMGGVPKRVTFDEWKRRESK